MSNHIQRISLKFTDINGQPIGLNIGPNSVIKTEQVPFTVKYNNSLARQLEEVARHHGSSSGLGDYESSTAKLKKPCMDGGLIMYTLSAVFSKFGDANKILAQLNLNAQKETPQFYGTRLTYHGGSCDVIQNEHDVLNALQTISTNMTIIDLDKGQGNKILDECQQTAFKPVVLRLQEQCLKEIDNLQASMKPS